MSIFDKLPPNSPLTVEEVAITIGIAVIVYALMAL